VDVGSGRSRALGDLRIAALTWSVVAGAVLAMIGAPPVARAADRAPQVRLVATALPTAGPVLAGGSVVWAQGTARAVIVRAGLASHRTSTLALAAPRSTLGTPSYQEITSLSASPRFVVGYRTTDHRGRRVCGESHDVFGGPVNGSLATLLAGVGCGGPSVFGLSDSTAVLQSCEDGCAYSAGTPVLVNLATGQRSTLAPALVGASAIDGVAGRYIVLRSTDQSRKITVYDITRQRVALRIDGAVLAPRDPVLTIRDVAVAPDGKVAVAYFAAGDSPYSVFASHIAWFSPGSTAPHRLTPRLALDEASGYPARMLFVGDRIMFLEYLAPGMRELAVVDLHDRLVPITALGSSAEGFSSPLAVDLNYERIVGQYGFDGTHAVWASQNDRFRCVANNPGCTYQPLHPTRIFSAILPGDALR